MYCVFACAQVFLLEAQWPDRNKCCDLCRFGFISIHLQKCFNPLTSNDAPMRHDLSELSIYKLMGIYMGDLYRRCTSVHGFCLF